MIQHQCHILDKDRVGLGVQRRQFEQLTAEFAQGPAVILVLRGGQRQVNCLRINEGQLALGQRGAGRAGDGDGAQSSDSRSGLRACCRVGRVGTRSWTGMSPQAARGWCSGRPKDLILLRVVIPPRAALVAATPFTNGGVVSVRQGEDVQSFIDKLRPRQPAREPGPVSAAFCWRLATQALDLESFVALVARHACEHCACSGAELRLGTPVSQSAIVDGSHLVLLLGNGRGSLRLQFAGSAELQRLAAADLRVGDGHNVPDVIQPEAVAVEVSDPQEKPGAPRNFSPPDAAQQLFGFAAKHRAADQLNGAKRRPVKVLFVHFESIPAL